MVKKVKVKESDQQSAPSLSWWSALNRRLITTQPAAAGKENLGSKLSPFLPENSQLCNFESFAKKFFLGFLIIFAK